MDFPEWDASSCGLSVRTDSLTVFVDLSRVPQPVAKAFRAVLQIPRRPSDAALPYSNGASLARAASAEFESLYQARPDQALQFATLLSAFFHEARHVHDLRATRIGAELLINDYKVYAGTQKLIEKLSAWQLAESSRRVPMPLSKSIDEYSLDHSFPAEPIRQALTQAGRMSNWWDARSRFRTVPGTSVRELVEALGFIVQIEWLAGSLGRQVAGEITHKTLGDEPFASPYLRPLQLLATFCQAKGIAFDPEPHDIVTLIVESLNVTGLDEAFSDGNPTDFHPGAWFDRFAHCYAELSAREDVTPEARSRAAVELCLRAVDKGDPLSRISEANEEISALQEELLRYLTTGSFRGGLSDEPILLATEIGVDFREMQRILSQGNSYFIPTDYVDCLMRGEYNTVYTRVKEEDGCHGDFLTPSRIPANHVGGIRHASESSQKMRILLGGRDFRNRSFFEECVFQSLKGSGLNAHNLKFRRID